MADYVIVPENVRAPVGAPLLVKLSASNIGPGNWVWEINSNYWALANCTNINAARVAGVSVGFAYTGQPLPIVSAGVYTTGNAAIPIGHALVLSNVAGQMWNHADLATNHYVTKLSWGNNTTTAQLAIEITGLQRA
jgi:hypothetical protein